MKRSGKNPCHDQFFLCSCQRYIQNAHLLCPHFIHCLFPNQLFQKCRRFCSPFQIDLINPNAPFRMKDHAAFRILCIKLFSHTCRKNNRKFQTFTLMNTHDPYRIRLFIHDPGFSVINVILFSVVRYTAQNETILCSLFLQTPLLFPPASLRLRLFALRLPSPKCIYRNLFLL